MGGYNDFRDVLYTGAFLVAFLNCQENLNGSKRRKPKGLATTALVESGMSEIPTYHSKKLNTLEKDTAKLLKTRHK